MGENEATAILAPSAMAFAPVNTSDFPENAIRRRTVIFRTDQWPPRGRCARKTITAAKAAECKERGWASLRRAIAILGGTPLANRHCPHGCSARGTCLRPDPDRSYHARTKYPVENEEPGVPGCICHSGYTGTACERVKEGFALGAPKFGTACFNGHNCSGHGRCVGRFCLCDLEWTGADCSLPNRPPRLQPAVTPPTSMPPAMPFGGRRVPIYIYSLPTDISLEYVYQRDMLRRGQYYANLMFMEALLRDHASIVEDPEQAALFFVPVMPMQMAGNLWHPYEFLADVTRHLREQYPYWNRTRGEDHVFFLTTDRAGCWKPYEIQHSLIITYLGFPAAEAYFGFEERLLWGANPAGPQRRNNAYDTRVGSVATELPCYVPGKDVVVPVDTLVKPSEEAKLPRPSTPYVCAGKRGKRTLLHMGGSMSNMGRIEYSQGVRQKIQELHANEPGFILGGEFTFDDLRAATFCLAPSGWGWGWRITLAMLTQCVPVIIQPNVTQPFEELLPYSSFSLRYTKDAIPDLPAKLRSIPTSKVCEMQTALARYYRALLWQKPHGAQHPSAYDLTMISLCRRAKALGGRFKRFANYSSAFLARHSVDCADSLEAAGAVFT